MKRADFTIRVINNNPHKVNSMRWRAGQVVIALEGCRIDNIIRALTALEADTGDSGVGDPARWLTHFSGLESEESGKKIIPWTEIIHNGECILNKTRFRTLLQAFNFDLVK